MDTLDETVAARKHVRNVIGALDAAMKQVRESIRGIPIRQGSFRKQHDNFARDVALLLVDPETTRGRIIASGRRK